MNEHRMGDFPIVEIIDDEGRPLRRYYKSPGAMNPRDPLARYQVVSRLKALPTPIEIKVVGKASPDPEADPPVYTSWQNLKADVQRLLDEPSAQPSWVLATRYLLRFANSRHGSRPPTRRSSLDVSEWGVRR
jgi:hypothetical protein